LQKWKKEKPKMSMSTDELTTLTKEYDDRKARMAPVASRTADVTTVERIHFEQVTLYFFSDSSKSSLD
jgi:hypothetical protein